MTTSNKKSRSKKKALSAQPSLSPAQLESLNRLRADEARDRRIADREEHFREIARKKSEKIFSCVNVDITPDEEAEIKEFLKERATQNKLKGFDAAFPEVMAKINSALEGYRINEYFSAPSDWLDGAKDYKMKYRREVKKLAKAFGDAAKALENITYFQYDALKNRHNELFIIDISTGPFTVGHQRAYPRKTSLVNGLRMIEEYLDDNSELEISMPRLPKSDCQTTLRNHLRDIYQFATGRKAPKQTTDWETGIVEGDFVYFAELIYEIAEIEQKAGHQIKRDR